ncbi:MAG: hypothetical protein LBL35_02760 [Clostridiales bacterium]|jgi:hypothetical protein|nr:hypothetical protein [Clostridiales bacterium]
MKYYLGGYFLMRLSPLKWGARSGDLIYTCSDCINENIIDSWSYSWTCKKEEILDEAKQKYDIDDDDIELIQNWVDSNFEKKKIRWFNIFSEVEIAIEYKNIFFPRLNDINLLGIYFDETETNKILEEFKRDSDIGSRSILSEKILEEDNGKTLGYDLIGMDEFTGQFHSFWCHDIGQELADRFGLNLNENGLFDNCLNWDEVLKSLSGSEIGCEPAPWHVTKVKMMEI